MHAPAFILMHKQKVNKIIKTQNDTHKHTHTNIGIGQFISARSKESSQEAYRDYLFETEQDSKTISKKSRNDLKTKTEITTTYVMKTKNETKK